MSRTRARSMVTNRPIFSITALAALAALLGLLLEGCDDGGAAGGTGDGGDAALRDVSRDDRGQPGADTASPDAPAQDALVEDGAGDAVAADTPAADAAADVTSDATELPGPDHLLVGCSTDAECPSDGDDPGVCCTDGLRYESYCSTLSECGPGRRDACLTDDQCQARQLDWTTCCHDRANYNFCAPSEETCQPHEACSQPSDCDSVSEPCCIYHDYYREPLCGSAFFALDPASECP